MEINLPKKININKMILTKKLFLSSNGVTNLYEDSNNSQLSFIRQINKYKVNYLKQIDHVYNELVLNNSLNHPFILKIQGFTQDEKYIYIKYEFVQGGEFFKYFQKKRNLDSYDVCFYSSQIILIFDYLHSLDIVYRDLKPENLLFDKDGYLKLINLCFIKKLSKKDEKRTYTICGTPEYLAPEIIKKLGYGCSVDWWTLGIFIYELISGIVPFFDENPLLIYKKILNEKIIFLKDFDKDAKSLVKHLLERDLSKRFGNLYHKSLDIKNHRFYEGLNWKDLLKKKINSPYIPNIPNIKDHSNFDDFNESLDIDFEFIIEKENDIFLNW